MITQEKLNNLHKLSKDDVLQIFHECEEILGLIDVTKASELLNISKRRIYQLMDKNNSIEIGSHKLPCLNLMIK